MPTNVVKNLNIKSESNKLYFSFFDTNLNNPELYIERNCFDNTNQFVCFDVANLPTD